MKPTVYIESSVISYLASKPGRDVVVAGRQAVTHHWWENHRERFELRISAAELLVSQGAVPLGSEGDALHIGIAVAQGVDYLLTWNFRHINNAERKAKITRTIEAAGLVCPQICSPEELGGSAND